MVPPTSHPTRGLVSVALGSWGDGFGEGIVKQPGVPPGGPPSCCSFREGPLKHAQLTEGGKALVGWRVSLSLCPPFCSPVSGQ